MSLSDHPKAYGSAALVTAFVAGALVTLGLKDLYPDLESSYQQRHKSNKSRRSSLFWGPVGLEDHTAAAAAPAATDPPPDRGASIVDGVEGCIGNTPLVRIPSLSEATGCTILAKAEFLNGAGNSPKDRVALSIIRDAEQRGLLVPHRGDTIYEGTVGSTGISLAALARAQGYCAHICMPDDQAHEKSDLLRHLGATVERVPVQPITSPDHFVNLARRRAQEHTDDAGRPSRGFFADQFESTANYRAHRATTGPEIHRQLASHDPPLALDALVAGAGTGGTISGIARYLKDDAGLSPLIVLADPQGSGLYHKIRHGVMWSPTEREGTRRRSQVDSIVEGVGINRITANLEAGRDLIDDAVRVTDSQACAMARWLAERDGFFVGSSSAVNCVAAVATAAHRLPKGSTVVTILCDPGTRHLSKFWKRIKELGLEEEDAEGQDLFRILGLGKPQ